MRLGRTSPFLIMGSALLSGIALVTFGGAASATVRSTASSPTTASIATVVDPDPSDRESMRQGYLQILRPAMQTPTGWTGNIATCDAGAPSAAAQSATLTAVNYFRDLVGVQPVTFDSALSAKAQKSALITAANSQLSHFPPDTWKCWTPEGYAAAGKSDLYLGVTAATAVAGYMVDPGSTNTFAGHRRWIIDPRQTTMGSGSVEGSGWQQTSNSLYVVDTASWRSPPPGTPAYLPWPVAGYVPLQIEPGGRWSLSATDPSTDFSQATVKVNGSSDGITVNPVMDGYGPVTLVWEFDPGFRPGDADKAFHVVVSNILNGGVPSSYSYDVTLFDADPPQLEAQTISFTKPAARSYGAAAQTLQATASSALPVTFASKTPAVCSTSGTRGRTLSVVGAGTCTVAANQSGDDTYGAAPEVQRSFTIAKKQLTVKAEDRARQPGQPNPDLDVSWSGFAYSETLASSGVTGDPSCSTTAKSDSPEGSYPISCSIGTLSSANYSFSFVPGSLHVDGTPPEVTTVGKQFRVVLGAFDVSWSGSDSSGVVAWQRFERSRTVASLYDGGSTSDWMGSADESLTLPDGATRCFQARAEDAAGNVSSWSNASCFHTPVDSRMLDASGGWTKTKDARLWHGSALTTKTRGEVVRLAGANAVDRLGLVATRCRGCGRVSISVGRTQVGVVDLDTRRTRYMSVIVLPTFSAPLSGPVKVEVLSKKQSVQVDGIVASSS